MSDKIGKNYETKPHANENYGKKVKINGEVYTYDAYGKPRLSKRAPYQKVN